MAETQLYPVSARVCVHTATGLASKPLGWRDAFHKPSINKAFSIADVAA